GPDECPRGRVDAEVARPYFAELFPDPRAYLRWADRVNSSHHRLGVRPRDGGRGRGACLRREPRGLRPSAARPRRILEAFHTVVRPPSGTAGRRHGPEFGVDHTGVPEAVWRRRRRWGVVLRW